jgi:hypothetical protein
MFPHSQLCPHLSVAHPFVLRHILTNAIDGADPVTCDGRKGSQGSRALVYWAEGLSLGMHEITLQHTGTQGQYLNIDYFLVTAP